LLHWFPWTKPGSKEKHRTGEIIYFSTLGDLELLLFSNNVYQHCVTLVVECNHNYFIVKYTGQKKYIPNMGQANKEMTSFIGGKVLGKRERKIMCVRGCVLMSAVPQGLGMALVPAAWGSQPLSLSLSQPSQQNTASTQTGSSTRHHGDRGKLCHLL
jgi:hypothetical protein